MLILGLGYVGGHLLRRNPGAVFTRRHAHEGALEFDLSRRETWAALPADPEVVWTFPAEPAETALDLFRARLSRARAVVVLGSTSAYVTTTPDEVVTEDSPLDLSQARVQGEEALRREGAMVLALAGIHGPGRDPARWLREGRIRNGARYANLAHVDDIVAAIEALRHRPQPGARINVCDGAPLRWSEHLRRLQACGRLPGGPTLPEAPDPASRRVSNDRLRALLGPAYRFHSDI